MRRIVACRGLPGTILMDTNACQLPHVPLLRLTPPEIYHSLGYAYMCGHSGEKMRLHTLTDRDLEHVAFEKAVDSKMWCTIAQFLPTARHHATLHVWFAFCSASTSQAPRDQQRRLVDHIAYPEPHRCTVCGSPTDEHSTSAISTLRTNSPENHEVISSDFNPSHCLQAYTTSLCQLTPFSWPQSCRHAHALQLITAERPTRFHTGGQRASQIWR